MREETDILRRGRHRRADAAFVGLVLLLSGGLLALPGRPGDPEAEPVDARYVRAEVLEVENTDVRAYGVIRQGEQEVRLRVLQGEFAGEEVDVTNTLLGDPEIDFLYYPGETILAVLNLRQGAIHWVALRGPYRIRVEIALAVLFAILLVAVAGWTGAKAVVSFGFAALLLWKVFIPLILPPYLLDPVPLALGVVAVLTGGIMFLVGGLHMQGLVAFLGGLLGLGLTCALALLFAEPFHATGLIRPFAKTVMARFPEIAITRVFLAGIFIASSGAVMDLAMDISAAMREIHEKHPEIGAWELGRSGLRVGRAVIGTMTTTLLLAYSGGYITMLMWFMLQEIPLVVLFNTNYVAAEIMNTLVGSFGLVTVAPFTAFVGGLLYTRWGGATPPSASPR